VESEAYRKKIEDQGAFATYMDPQVLTKFVDQESLAWAKIVKDANITAD
jgi:tripartite-type tricarboxylate transporter receptor subunit TctC